MLSTPTSGTLICWLGKSPGLVSYRLIEYREGKKHPPCAGVTPRFLVWSNYFFPIPPPKKASQLQTFLQHK